MKRFASVWDMRKAFTLIEVMIAVLIISVVIMALLQMKGNSSHIFFGLSKKIETNQYISFIVSDSDYGFQKQETTLDNLLTDFDIDDDLRQEFKKVNIKIMYQELEQIDMSEQDDENTSSGLIYKIGKTVLKTDKSSASLLRLRAQ